jgi:hypothetical protein
MNIDLTPLANLGIQILVPVVLAVGGVAIGRLARWFHLGSEAQLRDALQLAATNGAAFAMSQVGAIGAAGGLSVAVKSRVIAAGAGYVLAHVPDAAKKLGASQETIERLVEAKLAQLLLGNAQAAPGASAASPTQAGS